jgi:hypothetical protein
MLLALRAANQEQHTSSRRLMTTEGSHRLSDGLGVQIWHDGFAILLHRLLHGIWEQPLLIPEQEAGGPSRSGELDSAPAAAPPLLRLTQDAEGLDRIAQWLSRLAQAVPRLVRQLEPPLGVLAGEGDPAPNGNALKRSRSREIMKCDPGTSCQDGPDAQDSLAQMRYLPPASFLMCLLLRCQSCAATVTCQLLHQVLHLGCWPAMISHAILLTSGQPQWPCASRSLLAMHAAEAVQLATQLVLPDVSALFFATHKGKTAQGDALRHFCLCELARPVGVTAMTAFLVTLLEEQSNQLEQGVSDGVVDLAARLHAACPHFLPRGQQRYQVLLHNLKKVNRLDSSTRCVANL